MKKLKFTKETWKGGTIFINVLEDREGTLYLLKFCNLADKFWRFCGNEPYRELEDVTSSEEISGEDFFLEFL